MPDVAAVTAASSIADSGAFRPRWASPPGDTIRALLAERGMLPEAFARAMVSAVDPEALLNGRAAITIAAARRLSEVVGGSVAFWMTRDVRYRDAVAREAADRAAWIEELPVRDMVDFAWLPPVRQPFEQAAACLAFFGVPTVRAYHAAYAGLHAGVAFRTSGVHASKPGAVAAWVRQGEREAEQVACTAWDAEKLRAAVADARSLTRLKRPDQFLPRLTALCAAAGVAVALVRAPTGCRASGAARFVAPDRAMILLSARYLSDDHLWFTFFHEVGHLLLHAPGRLFIDGLEGDPDETAAGKLTGDGDDDAPPIFPLTDLPSAPAAGPAAERRAAEEAEANAFAADALIPPAARPTLAALSASDPRAVIRFAGDIGVSPGVVVGQLQHLGIVRYNQLARLRRRYTWDPPAAAPAG